MKRNIVLFMLISFFLSAFAEGTGLRMLESGRKWNYMKRYLTVTGIDTVYQSITIDGPVEFDGKQCYKFANVPLEEAKTLFYEEDGKVYVYRYRVKGFTGAYSWEKEFDFNLKAGEENVIAVDKIKINGENHKRLYTYNDYWIEGIGSLKSAVYSNWGLVPGDFMGSRLLTVYDGDKCIFNSDDYVWPTANNVVTGMDGVEAQKEDITPTFDLQGRRLTAKPQSGLYIRNGRKYVVK